jgi:hypothetical protein
MGEGYALISDQAIQKDFELAESIVKRIERYFPHVIPTDMSFVLNRHMVVDSAGTIEEALAERKQYSQHVSSVGQLANDVISYYKSKGEDAITIKIIEAAVKRLGGNTNVILSLVNSGNINRIVQGRRIEDTVELDVNVKALFKYKDDFERAVASELVAVAIQDVFSTPKHALSDIDLKFRNEAEKLFGDTRIHLRNRFGETNYPFMRSANSFIADVMVNGKLRDILNTSPRRGLWHRTVALYKSFLGVPNYMAESLLYYMEEFKGNYAWMRPSIESKPEGVRSGAFSSEPLSKRKGPQYNALEELKRFGINAGNGYKTDVVTVLKQLQNEITDPFQLHLVDVLLKNTSILKYNGSFPIEVTDDPMRSDAYAYYFVDENNDYAEGIHVVVRELDKTKTFDVADLLLHEIVHAYTAKLFLKIKHAARPWTKEERKKFDEEGIRPYRWKPTEREQQWANEIISLFHQTRLHLEKSGELDHYGLTDEMEFIAELWGNAHFRAKVREVVVDNKSLWQKFLDFVANLFGIKRTDQLDSLVNRVENFNYQILHEPLVLSFKNQDEKVLETAEEIIRHHQRLIDTFDRLRRRGTTEETINEYLDTIKQRKSLDAESLKKSEQIVILYRFFIESDRTLKGILNELGVQISPRGVLSFVNADKLTEANHPQMPVHRIYLYEKFINAFEQVLKSINSHATGVEAVANAFSDEELGRLKDNLNTIQNLRIRILERYRDEALHTLFPFTTVVDARIRRQITIQLRKDRPGLKGREFEAEMERILNQHFRDNKQDIDQERLEHLKSVLSLLPRDISFFNRYVFPWQHSNDQLIQLTKMFIDNIGDKAMGEYLGMEVEFFKIFANFLEAKGKHGDQVKQYEDIIEFDEDGTPLNWFVQEYRRGALKNKLDALLQEMEEGNYDFRQRTKARAKYNRETDEQPWIDAFYTLINSAFGEPSQEHIKLSERISELKSGVLSETDITEELLAEMRNLYEERDKHTAPLNATVADQFNKEVERVDTDAFSELEAKKIEEFGEDKARLRRWKNNYRYKRFNNRTGTYEMVLMPAFRTYAPRAKYHNKYENKNYVPGEKTPRAEWKSDRYQRLMARAEDDPIRVFYEHIMRNREEFDSYRPLTRRLDGRIPAVRKTLLERVYGKDGLNKFSAIGEEAKRNFQRLREDTEFGDPRDIVREDLEGYIHRFVPIRYSYPLEAGEQSFDIATIFLMDAHQSIKYKHINRIAPEVEAIRRAAEDRRVLTKKKRRVDSSIRELPPEDQVALKSLDDMIEDRVYGIGKLDQEFVGVMDGLQKYSSKLFLTANMVAGLQNVTYGTFVNTLEIAFGNRLERSQLIKATKHYYANLPGAINQYFGNDVHNKMIQLSAYYDSQKDFNGPRYRYSDDNVTKRVLKSRHGYIPHSAGEHAMQNIIMLAALGSVKIKRNGQYIDRDGKPTDKINAQSLYDVYQLELDGSLGFRQEFDQVNLNNIDRAWTDHTEFLIRQKIRGLNTQLHGAYGNQAKLAAERVWLGRWSVMLRKWLLETFRRQWGGVLPMARAGFTDPKTFFSDSSIGMLSDYELEEQFEGNFTSAVRWIAYGIHMINEHRAQGHIGAIGAFRESFRELDAQQQGNVHKAGVRTLVMMALWSISGALLEFAKEAEDDDEKNWLYGFTYQSMRLNTELGVFINPAEMLTLVKSPFPVVSAMADVLYFLGQSISDVGHLATEGDLERFKAGSRKDQAKLRKRFESIFPGVRPIHGWFHMIDKVNFANAR